MSSLYDAEKLVESIALDRFHGADWLSNAALGVMISIALNSKAKDSNELTETMNSYARRMAESRPSMAPIRNKLGTLIMELPEDAPLNELRAEATKIASRLITESRESRKRLIEHMKAVTQSPMTVITHSNSATVQDVILGLGVENVVVTESRPQYEGRDLAVTLAEMGVNPLLVVDSAMGVFMKSAEVAIVGADSVLYDGSFINKIGTRLMALSAREQGVPFYVVCDTWKFDVMNYLGAETQLEEKDPAEVAEGLEGVNVRNPYFEVVPGKLVSGIVTELGLMEPIDIRMRMEEMRRTISRLSED
ncbi:MAG: translation initiation factor eIF-2B [Candidatus Bathyarchaeota archaeon]|nr:translation initiation factor eIF-2B [Candidatus Bathyarchaeota archaeon]